MRWNVGGDVGRFDIKSGGESVAGIELEVHLPCAYLPLCKRPVGSINPIDPGGEQLEWNPPCFLSVLLLRSLLLLLLLLLLFCVFLLTFFFGPRVKWGHLNITFSLFFFAFWFPHVDPFHKMDPSSRDQLHSQGRDNFICFFTYRMAYGNSISHPIIARCWLCCVSFCFFRFLFVPFSPAFRPLMINGLDCLFLDRFHTSSDEFCLLARVRRLFSFPWLLSGFYCFFFLLVYRDVGVVFMDGCGSVIGCHLGYYRVLSG